MSVCVVCYGPEIKIMMMMMMVMVVVMKMMINTLINYCFYVDVSS